MTSAFDAKTALVALLTDRMPTIDSEVEIGYGSEWPSGQRPDKCVWCGEIQWHSTEYKTMGGSRAGMNESYSIALIIENRTPDSTQSELNAWVQSMYSSIESWLRVGRDNPKPIDIPQPITVIPKPQVLAEGPGKPDGSGRSAAFVILVDCTVRI